MEDRQKIMKKSRKKLVKKAAACLLSAIMLLSFAACASFQNNPEPVSSEDTTTSVQSLPSEVSSEYPSSDEALSSAPSSKVSSIASKIAKANTSSKKAAASSKAASSKPVSSKPVFSSKPASSKPVSSTPPKQNVVKHDEMKAVWLSFLEIQAFKGSSESVFTSKIEDIYDNIVAKGLNTVIVQVRPYGDSFYPSEYYPWSKCISGTTGVGVNYDPLAIMVREAHNRGLSVHAWINPYRTMTDAEMAQVDDSFAIKVWYNSSDRSSYMVKTGDSRWWLQPGNPEVQKLIINGASEIVQKYDVDGLHLDDYFYNMAPSAYGDTASEAKANTTALVRGLYQAVKAANPKVQFGVSPSGAFRSNQSLPSSDIGNLSTNLALWCSKPGYLDYVMPQIYWGYSHSTQPFTMTLDKWESFVTEPSVALYIGLAPYKLSASEIERQVQDIGASSRTSGYCLFRYDHIHALNLS